MNSSVHKVDFISLIRGLLKTQNNTFVMWRCRLLKKFEKKNRLVTIGYAMLMRPNKVETAVHGCLIPAQVKWRCACVRWWPHHGTGVTCVTLAFSIFFPKIMYGSLEIWNFSSRVQLGNSRVSANWTLEGIFHIWARPCITLYVTCEQCRAKDNKTWTEQFPLILITTSFSAYRSELVSSCFTKGERRQRPWSRGDKLGRYSPIPPHPSRLRSVHTKT